LAPREAVKRSYADPIEKRADPLSTAQLRRLTAPFILRRKKTDPNILRDLPEKIEIKERCRLTVEQAALYGAQLEEMKRRLPELEDDATRRGLILGTLTRLKQICNHPAQFLHEDGPLARRSGKMARLEELVEEILQLGEQALIFTQFTSAAMLLVDRIEDRFDISPLYLHGGVPHQRRQTLIDTFQRREAPLFVLSLRAAGTGLNLTAASPVISFARWWNPAAEAQSTDLARRGGAIERRTPPGPNGPRQPSAMRPALPHPFGGCSGR